MAIRALRRRWVPGLACSLLLAGCVGQPHKAGHAPTPANAPPPAYSVPPAPPGETGAAPGGQLPPAPDGMVGVASCDQYLSTYKACHRAAGIFAPGQIEPHYELMRAGLLRDARDPAKRGALDQRCHALSTQLQDALHGKSCNAAPTPGAGSNAGKVP